MRKIKFRVWDRKNKKMLPVEGICYFQGKDGLQIRAFEFENQPEKEDEIFLQNTGILDVKGVEIYEGDIVKNSANVIWWIVWDETKARWAYRRGGIAEQPFGRTGFGLTYNAGRKSEVVGNVYENYVLLQE